MAKIWEGTERKARRGGGAAFVCTALGMAAHENRGVECVTHAVHTIVSRHAAVIPQKVAASRTGGTGGGQDKGWRVRVSHAKCVRLAKARSAQGKALRLSCIVGLHLPPIPLLVLLSEVHVRLH